MSGSAIYRLRSAHLEKLHKLSAIGQPLRPAVKRAMDARRSLVCGPIEPGRLSACPCRRYNAKQPIRSRVTSGSDRFRLWGPRRVRAAGMTMVTGRCGVNYSDQAPSREWSVLKYQGETIAEVWFKPEADPF